MPYDVILLDFDHTLFDSTASEREAFGAALRAAGVETDLAGPLATYREINAQLWSEVEAGVRAAEEVRNERFARLADRLQLGADPESLADAYAAGLAAHGDLYPGTRAVLEALTHRATLALVTNGLTEVQLPRLERVGLSQLFSAVVVSSAVRLAKPDPAFFDLALGRLGDPPRDSVLIVGDSLSSDMAGGIAAGVATCWFNPHARPRPQDLDLTHEITGLGELLELV